MFACMRFRAIQDGSAWKSWEEETTAKEGHCDPGDLGGTASGNWTLALVMVNLLDLAYQKF